MTKIEVKIGDIIISITLVLTVVLWFFFQFKVEGSVLFSLISLNQIAALLGTLLLSWSMLLMTRLNFLEDMFDGLGNVYGVHKNTSIYGMVLIVVHALSLAILRLPNFDKAFSLFLPVHTQKFINIGVLSFWLFMVFIGTALLRKRLKFSYEAWKVSHKFSGVALILAFIHIILIPKTSPPNIFNLWLVGTTGVGIASWIYYEFFYKFLAPNYKYKVSKISKLRDVFVIKLKAIGMPMHHKPGQFAYLSFTESLVKKEIHPFTITSHPSEKELSFAIKILGDYTSSLEKLKVGDVARVWGPHGRFADKFVNTKKDVVLIGGGIGIAPFLSMLKEIEINPKKEGKVGVFYCTKYKCDACFDSGLEKALKDSPNISYLNKCSREGDRLSVSEIMKIENIENTLIFICGPKMMVSSLAKDLIAQKISTKNITSEYFDF